MVKLPEESGIEQLKQYASFKSLQSEIARAKKDIVVVYRKELETEIRKEILKRYYMFAEAGQLGFEQSAVYRFLQQQAHTPHKALRVPRYK